MTRPFILGEEEFQRRLISWARSLTPEEKASMREALYAHFGLPPEPPSLGKHT